MKKIILALVLEVGLSRQTHDLFSMEAVKFEVFSYMFFITNISN